MSVRKVIALTLAGALAVSPMLAEASPLPAGKAAGTKEAAFITGAPIWVILGLGAFIAGAIVVATHSGDTVTHGGTTTTTGTSS